MEPIITLSSLTHALAELNKFMPFIVIPAILAAFIWKAVQK